MKKTTGKVLSFVLSLALVLTSFPAMLASASTHHTVTGTLSDTDKDKMYLVNGGSGDTAQSYKDIQNYIFSGDNKDCTLETADHQHKETAKIAAISHKTGDRLVKWYDGDTTDHSSIDDDTNTVTLQLRSPTVKGHETLDVLYKATYTDDNDNDVTIKGSKSFDVYVYDKNATVIGKSDALTGGDKDDINAGKKSAELDGNFSEKTVSHEINNDAPTDNMNLTVWEATLPAADVGVGATNDAEPLVHWVALPTAVNGTANADSTYDYTLKSNNSNIDLSNGKTSADTTYTLTGGTAESTPTSTTYTMTAVPKAATTPGIALSVDGKLTVTAPTTATGIVDYAYSVGTVAPTDWSTITDTVPVDTATDISGKLSDGKTLYVAARDGDKAIVGTAANKSVVVANTPAVDAKDCPTIKAGTVQTKLSVDRTANDATAKTLAYTYSIDGSSPAAVTPGTDAIDLSTVIASGDHTIVVTATGKGSTTAKVTITNPAQPKGTSTNDVYASVKKASSGTITFTAEATAKAKALKDDAALSTTKNITVKSKIDKKIKVDLLNFTNIVKYDGSTYVSKNSSLDKDSIKDKTASVKVNSLEVNFDGATCANETITVADKASVGKISGKLKTLNISGGSNVDSIALDKCNPKISVSDARVGDIDFDKIVGDGKNELDVDSTKASVGNVTDATEITVKSGKTGNLTADDKIEVDADDDTATTTVGDVKSHEITLNSQDSKLNAGTVSAKNDDAEITLEGDNLTVKAIDFDNRNASLKFDDFQGKIAAPKNAAQDGANITTTNGDDRVTITGDCDVDEVSVTDDSQVTFDSKLNVTDVDGSGTLVVGAGKMYIDGSASNAILKLSDATLTKGMTAFTSANDTVNADDFDCYGFTLAKSTSGKTDTFKVDSIVFKGLSINKASSEIANGYSETFTPYAYPGGTTMPKGYTVKWSLDCDDSIFSLTTNANGTATVKVVGYDKDFASNDKATLKATLVDPDGDECDSEDYAVGECDLTALEVPKVTHSPDTTKNFNLAQGASYQFKITSSDGSEPTMSVGSGSLAVAKVGKSGNAYFFKVTAVGKVGDTVGVYLDKSRLLVITISASSVKLDTGAKINVAKGKTYQFKAISTTAVKATSGNSAVFQVVKSTKTGNNTYVTVKATGSKGQSTGIYFNGVRRTIATVA